MFCCEGKFYLVYLFHALIPISLGGCRNDGFILSEIIRTKGYGFVWVSGAGNAMKFNEKMQET